MDRGKVDEWTWFREVCGLVCGTEKWMEPK